MSDNPAAEKRGERVGNVSVCFKFFGRGGFNPTMDGFISEWKALSDKDKVQLTTGIQDLTFTY